MKSCQNCKHGKTAFKYGPGSIGGMSLLIRNCESSVGDMYGKCENGNQDVFEAWWKKSVGISSTLNPEVPCYEATDLHKNMDRMISTLDKMLKIDKN